MLFTSYKFLIFFVAVFFLYWIVAKKSKTAQNAVLLLASYVFYGIAEWKMIPLLLVSTAIFYCLGNALQKTQSAQKQSFLSWIGILLGLGVLLYFKYFNFFIQSFSDLFTALGLQTNLHTFKIIMPLGVSYFTFKLISYVLEVERGRMVACKDPIAFAIYVSFFPTIMAGPIDRPNMFLPQLDNKRKFDGKLGIDGFQQIIWGLFKKVIIADNLSPFIDSVWTSLDSASGSTIIIALIFYSVQMYADFSGYSDMAIGLSKLLGLRIAKNFNYPFFATNIAEFWRRWHISLTGWLTDYVFIPLNIKFRDLGNLGIILAIVINMVLVGMWHGENWTYAVFGLYQGLLFVPVILAGKMNKKQKLILNRFGGPKLNDICKMFGIFMLYTIGAILFRAENLSQSLFVITQFFNKSIIYAPEGLTTRICLVFFIFISTLALEWHRRTFEYALQPDVKTNIPLKKIFIYDVLIILVIFVFGNFGGNQFIYFQF